LGQPRSASAVLVSERAVGTDQDKRFVIVVGPDNKAAWREVQLGAAVDGLRIVTEGLQGGERVVVNGLHRVRPGTLVAPQPVAMEPQPQRQASGDAAPGRS
jgi:multidrug efflux system membrane fusion protein